MRNYIIAAIIIILVIGGIIYYRGKNTAPVDNGVATTTDTTDTGVGADTASSSDVGSTTAQ